jgi:hypothetical protein
MWEPPSGGPPASHSQRGAVPDGRDASKVAEGNFSFLRTNAVYKRSMEIAYRKWKWLEQRLK